MEAIVLLGLVGIGHLKNKSNGRNHPVVNNVDDPINTSNGNNIYDAGDYYKETNKDIINIAKNNFDDSFIEGSNVINSKKVQKETKIENLVENFSDKGVTYSSISDEFIQEKDFMKNDQGYTMQPFFKKEPIDLDLNDTRQLDRHQGDNRLNESKKEVPSFFQWEKNHNVFGNQFGEYIGDKSRYVEGNKKTNELPFEQVRVSHIDTRSDLNREIKEIIANKTNIDNTRSKDNPKLSYQGRVISGKKLSEKRGTIGQVNQYDPDKFYENSEDRYFKTTGAFLKKSERPDHLLKDTYRATLNDQPLGGASANYSTGEKRSKFKKPIKTQLPTDTTRNTGAQEFAGDADFGRSGYRSVPNEREVTSERTYQGNLKTNVGSQTIGVLDNVKKTIKETTIDSKNNGYIGSNVINNTIGPLDSTKITKKQTTIDSKNNGNITGGYQKLTVGYETPEKTTKDTILSEYTGNAGSSGFSGDMSKFNYMNAETNPNKELIARGRSPTLNNTKVINGAEHQNIDIKKIESDYINQSANKIGKVYSSGPTSKQYELTTMKNKLNDTPIYNRIDKDLLNPFKENPYTQSLSSFAY